MKESFLSKIRKEAGLDLRETSEALESVSFHSAGGAVVKKEGGVRPLKWGDVSEIIVKTKKEWKEPNRSDAEMLVKTFGNRGLEIALLDPEHLPEHMSENIIDFLSDSLIEQDLCNYVAVVKKSDRFVTYQIAEVQNIRKGVEDPLLMEGDTVIAKRINIERDLTKDEWEEVLAQKKFFDIKERAERDEREIGEKRERSKRVRDLR